MLLELNNSIRQLQDLARERKCYKKFLTDKILSFMSKYGIDELKTKDGKLIYKSGYVTTRLSQSVIKQRLEEVLQRESPDRCQEISCAIFQRERLQKQRLALQRIKIT